MQNFFLHPALGRNPDGPGHAAIKKLLEEAIPAARKANIRICWVNWGVTEEEVESAPVEMRRAFGEAGVPIRVPVDDEVVHSGGDTDKGQQRELATMPLSKTPLTKNPRLYKGLGAPLGSVALSSDETVDAGRMLMRSQWNTELYGPLAESYDHHKEGSNTVANPPDAWIHKNRLSALWGSHTDLEDFLEENGIRTLLFAGVNTDQCVAGTMVDAFSKGYDCILLKDGCGTTSPDFARSCIEFNTERTWGFVSECRWLSQGVDGIKS
jgi:nicotinamidase-related amidase